MNQNEIGNGGGRGYYPDDDDIHNMLATGELKRSLQQPKQIPIRFVTDVDSFE